MSRRATALVTVLMAALLVSATPATAATVAVGGVNTTAADFNNANELTNVSVQGTGTGADVVYDGGGIIDGFEDGDVSEYTGDTGAFSATTTAPVYDGTYSLHSQTQSQILSQSGLERYLDRGETAAVQVSGSNSSGSTIKPQVIFFAQNSSNYYVIDVQISNDKIVLFKRDSGLFLELDAATVSLSNNTEYRVEVSPESNGDITAEIFAAGGSTPLASATATDTTFNDGGVGFRNGGGDVVWDDYRVTDAPDTARYVGAAHTVGQATSAWVNVSVSGTGEATITWEGRSGGGAWADITSTTVSTTTNVSQSVPATYDEYRANVTFSDTGDGRVVIHDEGVLFTNSGPALDAGTATPSGGTTVDSGSATLAIDVSDPTFATAQGDTENISFYLDGEYVGHTDRSSNGTASVTVSGLTGGQHTWYARATDAYGESVRSDSDAGTAGDQDFTFQSPSELEIRNESAPESLVDNAEVSLRFYYNESGTANIINRTTTDGTVSFDGLPVGEEFVVVADADSYTQRRIYVDSLVERSQIYLLPESRPQATVEFSLQDFSGRYPQSETVLKVQRGLNGTYRTVEADFFGASGAFPTNLRLNARHRLIALNTETGREKVLGTYTAIGDTTETITISRDGSISIRDGGASVTVQPALRSLRPSDSETVSVNLQSNNATISQWRVVATYRNESTTVELANVTQQTDGGTIEPTLALANRSGGNVTVNVSWTTVDGETESVTGATFTVRQSYNNQFSLLTVLGGLPDHVPDQHASMLTTLLAVVATILTATAVAATLRVSTEIVGLAALIPLAGFAIIGWVGYGPVFIGGVAWVAMSGLRRGI